MKQPFSSWRAWAVCLALGGALVFTLDRVLPMNADEVLSYHPIACRYYPHNRANVFSNDCSLLDLQLAPGVWMPRAFVHKGPALALVYLPLYLAFPHPWSARLLAVLLLAAQGWLLGRLTKLPGPAVFLALLAFFPYSFMQLVYGTVALHCLLVLAGLWALERLDERPLSAGMLLGFCVFFGLLEKLTFLWALPGLALYALRRLYFLPAKAPRFLAGILAAGALPCAWLLLAHDRSGAPYVAALGQGRFAPDGRSLWDKMSALSAHWLNAFQPTADFFLPVPLYDARPWTWLGASAMLLIFGLIAAGCRLRRSALAPVAFAFGVFLLTFAFVSERGQWARHVIIALPFLALSAGLAAAEFGRRGAAAALLAAALYLPCWAYLSKIRHLAINDASRGLIARKLYDPGLSSRYAYVVLDWGVYQIQALYGPKDQMVLYLQDLRSPAEVARLQEVLKGAGRKALFILQAPASSADVPLLQRSFKLERMTEIPAGLPWAVLRES